MNEKTKASTDILAVVVIISAITLLLLAAATIESLTEQQKASAQRARANCIESPDGKNFACSGSGGSASGSHCIFSAMRGLKCDQTASSTGAGSCSNDVCSGNSNQALQQPRK